MLLLLLAVLFVCLFVCFSLFICLFHVFVRAYTDIVLITIIILEARVVTAAAAVEIIYLLLILFSNPNVILHKMPFHNSGSFISRGRRDRRARIGQGRARKPMARAGDARNTCRCQLMT